MGTVKTALRDSLPMLPGLVGLTAVMLIVYAALDKLTPAVWTGAAVGLVLALGNFFFTALSAGAASEKAAQQDVSGGKALMTLSSRLRPVALLVLLILGVKLLGADAVASALPLLFVFPVLVISQWINKRRQDT